MEACKSQLQWDPYKEIEALQFSEQLKLPAPRLSSKWAADSLTVPPSVLTNGYHARKRSSKTQLLEGVLAPAAQMGKLETRAQSCNLGVRPSQSSPSLATAPVAEQGYSTLNTFGRRATNVDYSYSPRQSIPDAGAGVVPDAAYACYDGRYMSENCGPPRPYAMPPYASMPHPARMVDPQWSRFGPVPHAAYAAGWNAYPPNYYMPRTEYYQPPPQSYYALGPGPMTDRNPYGAPTQQMPFGTIRLAPAGPYSSNSDMRLRSARGLGRPMNSNDAYQIYYKPK